MDGVLLLLKKAITRRLFNNLQPIFHKLLALIGAVIYRFPANRLKVVAITGTKGKTSTAEFVNAVLEGAGFKTAITSTLRFKIGSRSEPNRLKMTMPGRFFMQKFLRRAVDEGCQWAVLEMTSEGAKQSRHCWVYLDSLIFTNLAPEHIESHGSYEKYRDAKLSIARDSLARSPKRPRTIIVNADDKEAEKFLAVAAEKRISYRLDDAKLFRLTAGGIEMTFEGETIRSPLRGKTSIYNILAAAAFGRSIGIPAATIKKAVERVNEIKGRLQSINEGQGFEVIIDYAHTPDSLRALYETFAGRRKICVLGNTGGGRDKWKRPVMGQIADEHCDEIILTDEDPYDEDPLVITKEMAAGIKNKKPEIVMDRREAIRRALALAKDGDVVLVTGKGTDPCIMGPKGERKPWSDEAVARELLRKLRNAGGEQPQ